MVSTSVLRLRVLTYHKRYYHADTPCIKDVNKVLFYVTIHPSNGPKNQYNVIKKVFAEHLSFVIHVVDVVCCSKIRKYVTGTMILQIIIMRVL